MSQNILEKVIESQEEQRKAELNLSDLLDFLLADLNSREREVINARYGLNQEKRETLESIGKNYGITRERVRQIEKNALKKVLAVKGSKEKLADLVSMVVKNINTKGWIYLEESLFEDILEASREVEIDKNRLSFVFEMFLGEYIEPVEVVHTEKAWKLKERDVEHFEGVVNGVKNILERTEKPHSLVEILTGLEKELVDEKLKKVMAEISDWQEAVNSYLEISKHFKKNLFDKWGMASWRSVNPKRMRDKVYLIFQKENKPLHYKDLARLINEEVFDAKRAHPATIHNELILDDRYVLIGRGIYALKDWGYKPGMIVDVVKDVLREAGAPLTKDEITREVLKQRMVKEGSVSLALSQGDVFERISDGRYQLKG